MSSEIEDKLKFNFDIKTFFCESIDVLLENYKIHQIYYNSSDDKVTALSNLITISNQFNSSLTLSESSVFDSNRNLINEEYDQKLNAVFAILDEHVQLCGIVLDNDPMAEFLNDLYKKGLWTLKNRVMFSTKVSNFKNYKNIDMKAFSLNSIVGLIVDHGYNINLPDDLFTNENMGIDSDILHTSSNQLKETYSVFWNYLLRYWKKNEMDLRKKYVSSHAIAVAIRNHFKVVFPYQSKYPHETTIRERLNLK